MAFAAVVVSVLALVVAGLSALYTRQQTSAAKAMLHLSREPDLQLGVEPHPNEPFVVSGDLIVTHVTGPDLARVDLEIIVPGPSPGRSVEVPIPEFGPGNHSRFARTDALRQGEGQVIPVVLNPHPPKGHEAVFRLTCTTAEDECWPITRRVTPTWPPLGPLAIYR